MRRLIAAILIALFSTPIAAHAFDIPLLTWERGRAQQVVLGGGAYSANWTVTLEGSGIAPLTFSRSAPNEAGFVVYSINIPSDLPVGAYSVSTSGKGSPKTVVAGIALVEAQTKTATTKLIDLTVIIAIFVFLTTVMGTLRARKYSILTGENSQFSIKLEEENFTTEKSFLARLSQAPNRIRINSLRSIRISLFQFLLIREGELLHRLSRPLYGALPFIAFTAGAIAAVEANRNQGLAQTGIAIFIAITILAIFDAFSGLLATIGFWAIQLFSGNITSIRDVLLMFSLGLTWVGTSLIAGLLKENIGRDLPSGNSESGKKYFGALGAAVVGSSIFYLGHALIDSVLYVEAPLREISITSVAIIAAAILAKSIAEISTASKRTIHEVKVEEFFVARVSSPQTALILFGILFGFLYIWTENSGQSLLISALFTTPYFLIFISLSSQLAKFKKLPPRNILLESALVAAISFITYRQISGQPLLIDDQANFLLLISAIPGILHAIYSAMYAASEKKEIISA